MGSRPRCSCSSWQGCLSDPTFKGRSCFSTSCAGLAGGAAVARRCQKDRQAPRLVNCDARRLRDLHPGAADRSRRSSGLRRDLHPDRACPWRGSRTSRRDSGGCHRRRPAGNGHPPLGALFSPSGGLRPNWRWRSLSALPSRCLILPASRRRARERTGS